MDRQIGQGEKSGTVKIKALHFAEEDGHQRDAIAVRQLHALKEHIGPRDKPLRLSDVKRMFILMNNKA